VRTWFRKAPAPPVEMLVVGLGNPGGRYAGTRHNVGFAVVDRLRARGRTRALGKRYEAKLWQRENVLLAKPQTFVNLSGRAVRLLCRAYDLKPSQVLVIADEVNLPPGKLRLRRRGSAGGHRGLRSIIDALGTTEVPRLRLGVGRPTDPDADLVEHVLSRFPSDQQPLAEAMFDRAAECVEVCLAKGIEAAMNQFNS